MSKQQISKVDRDINEEMGYTEDQLRKIDQERWAALEKKGDPRTKDRWDGSPIDYEHRKQRCNSVANSRAYWAFRCDKQTHECNVVRDYLIKHDLPVPQDFNNPVELQPTGMTITPEIVPDAADDASLKKPNLRQMWAMEHDIKMTVPIYNNNIFILTDKDQFDKIVEKMTK